MVGTNSCSCDSCLGDSCLGDSGLGDSGFGDSGFCDSGFGDSSLTNPVPAAESSDSESDSASSFKVSCSCSWIVWVCCGIEGDSWSPWEDVSDWESITSLYFKVSALPLRPSIFTPSSVRCSRISLAFARFLVLFFLVFLMSFQAMGLPCCFWSRCCIGLSLLNQPNGRSNSDGCSSMTFWWVLQRSPSPNGLREHWTPNPSRNMRAPHLQELYSASCASAGASFLPSSGPRGSSDEKSGIESSPLTPLENPSRQAASNHVSNIFCVSLREEAIFVFVWIVSVLW